MNVEKEKPSAGINNNSNNNNSVFPKNPLNSLLRMERKSVRLAGASLSVLNWNIPIDFY